MRLETELNIALTEFFRPIIAQCFREVVQTISVAPSITTDPDLFGDHKWLRSTCVGIPDSTLRQWDAAGKIPGSSKVGKRKIYDKKAVIDWLRSQTRQPVDMAAIERTADEQVSRQLTTRKRGGKAAA